MAIGLFAAATPFLFVLIQGVYVKFSLDVVPDHVGLTLLRVGLGVTCLGLPTVLMGSTFPLMFKYLRSLGLNAEKVIAPLYSANTLGAAVGSTVAGYWILPTLGRNGGTYLAAAVSLMVGLYVLDRQKKMDFARTSEVNSADRLLTPLRGSIVERRSGLTALAILLVGGAVTLGLEINTMHLLAVVAGNSVYAFALMLATFLIGLGLGSSAGLFWSNYASRLSLIGWAQCGLAFSICMTTQLWDQIPSYFASFGIYPAPVGFSGREVVRAMVCTVAMLPPAFFIGCCYPPAMSLATEWLSPKGGAKGLGTASALNTFGNILGVVLTGFWMLPAFGSRIVCLIFAVTALGLAFLAFSAKNADFERNRWPLLMKWAPWLGGILSLWLIPNEWNYNELASGANVYFQGRNWGEVIDKAESVEGGMTLVAKDAAGVSTLLTNGKFQGNNALGGEMIAQESFALFPLLHTDRPEIGFGHWLWHGDDRASLQEGRFPGNRNCRVVEGYREFGR